jgi:cystathionine gamma-synthase/methionine-gamma-lyase
MTGGVICCSKALAEDIWHTHITLGSVLSPMDAWLLLRGLRTLPMRIERINANALALATFLEQQPQIERVYYPGLESHPQHELACRQMNGFGGVVAFGVRGGYAEAERLVSALKVPHNAGNLGGVDSLVIHTAAMWAGTMSAAQMAAADIPVNFIRYSVGIEHIDDLKADLLQALATL